MEALGQAKKALRHAYDEHWGKVLQGQQLLRLSSDPEVFGGRHIETASPWNDQLLPFVASLRMT